MRINVNRYKQHTLSSKPLKFFFPTASLMLTAEKLFQQVMKKERSVSFATVVDMKF